MAILDASPEASSRPECVSHPAVSRAAVGLSIGEAAIETGVSAHTLRYYERIGLLSVPRDDAGRRIYGPVEVGRAVFISLLRAAAMPIRDLQTYFCLVDEGDGNERDRIAVLERHREHVQSGLDDLRNALSLIDLKLDLYRAATQP